MRQTIQTMLVIAKYSFALLLATLPFIFMIILVVQAISFLSAQVKICTTYSLIFYNHTIWYFNALYKAFLYKVETSKVLQMGLVLIGIITPVGIIYNIALILDFIPIRRYFSLLLLPFKILQAVYKGTKYAILFITKLLWIFTLYINFLTHYLYLGSIKGILKTHWQLLTQIYGFVGINLHDRSNYTTHFELRHFKGDLENRLRYTDKSLFIKEIQENPVQGYRIILDIGNMPFEIFKKSLHTQTQDILRCLPNPNIDQYAIELEARKYDVILNMHKKDVWEFIDYVPHSFSNNQQKPLEVCFGFNKEAQPVFADLTALPHLLIAGQTGGGKSVHLENIMFQLLEKMALGGNIKLVVFGKKQDFDFLENLNCSDRIDFYGLSQTAEMLERLKQAVKELENRDRTGAIPHTLCLVIDEIAHFSLDSEVKKEFELCIRTIGSLGRSYSIHLILATQSPKTEVITGIIKANLPSVICTRVRNLAERQTVLGLNAQYPLEQLPQFVSYFYDNGTNREMEIRAYKTVIGSTVKNGKTVFLRNPHIEAWLKQIRNTEQENTVAEVQAKQAIPPTIQPIFEAILSGKFSTTQFAEYALPAGKTKEIAKILKEKGIMRFDIQERKNILLKTEDELITFLSSYFQPP